MRTKKIIALVVCLMMLSSVALAATGDVYNLEGTLFATANEMNLSSAKRNQVNVQQSQFLYEGQNGNLYRMADANDAFVSADYNWDEFLNNLETKTPVIIGEEELKVVEVSAINSNNVEVTPLAGATNVQSNATFKVVFEKAIDSTTVTASTVKLYGTNPITKVRSQVGLTGIGLLNTDATNKTVVARPVAHLNNGWTYELEITTGLKDVNGQALAENLLTSFTVDQTAVITANGISANIPPATRRVIQKNANLTAAEIAAGSSISIVFDSGLDVNTVNASNVRVKDLTTQGTPYVAYTLATDTTSVTNDTIVLTWGAASLTAGNGYQIEINNLKTNAGHSVANEIIPFTANASPLTIATLTTKDGDSILAGAKVYPNLSGGFVTPGEIQTYKQGPGLVITFGTTPMASTVTTDNIYITKKGDTEKIPAEITYNTAQPTVVRLNPTVNLEERTVYTLHVSKDVKTAAGLALTDALTQDFSTYDLTPPQVVSVTGTDNVQAGVQNTITVAFNEAISIYDKSNNNAIINVSKASGATGAALANNNALNIHNVTTNANAAARLDSVALSTDAKSLIIKVTPTAAEVNTVFRITLNAKDTPTSTNAYFTDRFNTTTATTSSNNSLVADYEIYFTTAADNVKPTVTKVVAKYDDNGASVGNNVEIQGGLVSNIDITAGGTLVVDFSKNNIDGTTVTAANVKIHNVTTNTDTGATVEFKDNEAPGGRDRMTVTYGGALTPGNKYELRIGTGLKDTNNNAIAAVAFPFIAGQGPNVAATSPASLATLANNNANTAVGEPNSTTTTALDEPIFINFGVGSTAIDPNTLEGNVVLTKVGGSDVAITTSLGLAAGGSFTPGAQYLKITPSANLEGSSSYRVTLRSGIKDINGNALAVASSGRGPEDYTFVFYTPDEVKPTVASIKSGSTELVGNEILNHPKPEFTVTFSEPVARAGDSALVASQTPNLADDVLLYTATEYATPTVAPTTSVDVAGVASTRMGDKTNTYTTWTITPNSNLTPGDYVLVIKGDNTAGASGVEDANGNPMAADYVYRFTATATGQDLTAPAFVNVKPTDKDGKVINVVNDQGDILWADISAPLVLGFNEAINITGATVTVRDLSVSPVANVGILPLTRVDYNAASDNQGLRVTFAAPRVKGHIYEITVSGVKDIAGNTAPDFTIFLTQRGLII